MSNEVVRIVPIDEIISGIPSEAVDRTFVMNPETEDVIRGGELQEGMVVLLEDHMFRLPLHSDKERDFKATWCQVTKLQRNVRDEILSFIGVYSDGVKHSRTYNRSIFWLVKKDSVMS